jgi:hypothetical protein
VTKEGYLALVEGFKHVDESKHDAGMDDTWRQCRQLRLIKVVTCVFVLAADGEVPALLFM